MVGLLGASIGSGQIITRTGRYKVFPIVGTAVAAVGLLLLSSLDAESTTCEAALYMFVLGAGLGLVMQVLILAVQNAVPYAQLGVATSAATLFRSMGGSLGTALLGAIFANRLTHELAASLPSTPAARGLGSGYRASQVQSLPPPIHDPYIGAFVDSFSTVFLIAACIVALAFVLSWFLEERPLRQTIEETGLEHTFAPPGDTDSLDEITRQLGRLVGQDRTRRFIEGVIDEADVDATPAEAWLLGRSRRNGRIPGDALDTGDSDVRERLAEGAARLLSRGLVDRNGELQLTETGADLRNQLIEARCRRLTALVADWEPEAPEVDAMIERLAEELGWTPSDPPRP